MNSLSSFMISFCSASIILGFLYMICPSGSMTKSVKYVFCLCFLCCILSVVTNLPKINFDAFDLESNNEIITEQTAAATAQTVFSQALVENQINFKKITVDTNKLSDGSITISRVTVYTSATAEQINSVIGTGSYEVNVINE